jgi:hypothetical protein
MPKKEWLAEFNGHQIRVVNTWLGGAKLYIDGDVRDTSAQQITVDKKGPLLSARLPNGDGGGQLVEVFLVAWFTTKAKICIDGKQIAGDVL